MLNCEFLYIAKMIVTANCQTFVWQILQPRHYLLQLIQLCALSLKKTRSFLLFSAILFIVQNYHMYDTDNKKLPNCPLTMGKYFGGLLALKADYYCASTNLE